jgi:septal ring factor EnvC (AmiA/AmiB activator)
MGGIVRFADDFKNYGKLVIIEHKNGYHSLLGGLGRIDSAVGQPVKAGEPIGILPKASSRGGKPALYYELRRNGNPVDPGLILADLQS